MKLVEETHGKVHMLRLSGKLEMSEAPVLKETLKAKISSGCKNIVIDMRSVSFVDSSGFGALIEAAHTMAQGGGSFKLLGAQNRVKLLLNENVVFCETEEEALAGS